MQDSSGELCKSLTDIAALAHSFPLRPVNPVPYEQLPGGLLSRRGEGGRGFGTQKFVYRKWPDFGLGRG